MYYKTIIYSVFFIFIEPSFMCIDKLKTKPTNKTMYKYKYG